MTVHRLILRDRGSEHVHKWAPECSCGRWVGRYRRRRKEAVEQHRVHAFVEGRGERSLRTTSLHGYGPQRVTPTDELPELLR